MSDVMEAAEIQTGGFEEIRQILRNVAKQYEEIAKAQKEITEAQKETDRIVKENIEAQKETDRQMKETDRQMKETDRQMKETDRQIKETDRQMKETDRQIKETDRQIKEYNKRFGDFTKNFGKMVEYMVGPNLVKKFYKIGLNFLELTPNKNFIDKENNIFFEVDYFLENSNMAMLVEVKSTLTKTHVKSHVKRLKKMRIYADLRGDKRTFLGAIAGVAMTPMVKQYALEQGFYVIEPSGETFNITPPEGQPKEW